jgi:hypothetical protein
MKDKLKNKYKLQFLNKPNVQDEIQIKFWEENPLPF